ncbi:UrcA family protein [Alteriqipengyuania lutimaris]|nr:UrcA family protein [Alteriqipengyuania lutimaris]MBB3034276.1 UrcA family protein [Alteriqipengyuania lutimaris]
MKALAFAVAITLTAGSSPTLADPGENRALVSYNDLDLGSSAGQARLDRRLDDAVKAVCRLPHSRSVRTASEAQACIAQLRTEVAQLRARIIAEAQLVQPEDKRD